MEFILTDEWGINFVCSYNSDMPQLIQSGLSPFIYTGTMTDTFHCQGISSLLQINLIRLSTSEHTVLPPPLTNSTGI